VKPNKCTHCANLVRCNHTFRCKASIYKTPRLDMSIVCVWYLVSVGNTFSFAEIRDSPNPGLRQPSGGLQIAKIIKLSFFCTQQFNTFRRKQNRKNTSKYVWLLSLCVILTCIFSVTGCSADYVLVLLGSLNQCNLQFSVMEKEVWQPVTLIMQSAWKTKQIYLLVNIYKWEWLSHAQTEEIIER